MNENLQALLQKVAESEELQSRFAKVSTPEEAYEVAKEIQGGFTKEEFLEAAKALAEAADEDISDADLASAAGGMDEPVDQKVMGNNVVTIMAPPVIGTKTIPVTIKKKEKSAAEEKHRNM